MSRPARKAKEGEMWCHGCSTFKNGQLFNPNQWAKSDEARLCMMCQRKRGAVARKRHYIRAIAEPGRWCDSLHFKGSHF